MTPAFLRYTIMLGAAAGIGLLTGPARAFDERECPVPERFYASQPTLTKTTKALAGGRNVVITALGGSSTTGYAAGGLALSWPARLNSALAEKFPAARTKVVNLAVERQTAKRALQRLDRDVFPLKPALVVWETGTMEAVRGINVDEFRDTVQDGITEIRAAGAEVVLMNMQFSRETDTVINFSPYLVALRELADGHDVPLFRRHGIMRHWAEIGTLDLRAREGEKSREVAVKLYECLGRAMANFVTRGIPAAKAASGPGSER
jgi:hypothetical protein